MVARDLWSINSPSPRAKPDARIVYGHESLATAVYLLYSQADWFNGTVATTNMVTEIVSSQSKKCIDTFGETV